MSEKIKLQTQLSWEDIKNFNFYILYRRGTTIFITIIGVIMLLFALSYFLGFFSTLSKPPIGQLLMGLVFTIGLPLFTIYSARKQFNSTGRFNEKITYTFDKVWIEIIGESFETKITWEKLHKVRETDKWFLLFANKNMAHIIPKDSLSNLQISSLRTIIRSFSNPDFKVNS